MEQPDRPSGKSCRACQRSVIVSERVLMQARALPLAAAEAIEDGPRMALHGPANFGGPGKSPDLLVYDSDSKALQAQYVSKDASLQVVNNRCGVLECESRHRILWHPSRGWRYSARVLCRERVRSSGEALQDALVGFLISMPPSTAHV